MNSLRHTPFDLTESERRFPAPPVTASELREALIAGREQVIGHIIRAYVRDRVPAAFNERPMLWEAVRHWFASRLSQNQDVEVLPSEIGIVGSANLGFSAAFHKYGKNYEPGADLDLFVVNESLFQWVQLDV